jgi:outer membrane protein assembly factor BamB
MSPGTRRSREDRRKLAIAAAGGCALAILVAVLLVNGSSGSRGGSVNLADSRLPNVDAFNSRHAEGPISSSTVSALRVAWRLPIGSESNRDSPVVSGGVAFSQSLDSDVRAIDLESGEVLWEKPFDSPTEGPKGVLLEGGLVYGATASGAFALDRETGEEIWSTRLTRTDAEQISMAPGYFDGLVYFSTEPGDRTGGEVGVLWALEAATGRKAWSFETVPNDLWGNESVNFGGGLTHSPAFDGKGSMYVGVGSPGPAPGTRRYPWGASRPGRNLYTDSVVKLDAKTGALRWYHQITPHDVCNGDIGPPVLVEVGDRKLVIAGSKSGVVVALDQGTGRQIWRRSVGVHTGDDQINLYAMRREYARLKTPMTIFPGAFGGVYAPMAVSGSTAFVPVVNYGATVASQLRQIGVEPPGGELVALNIGTGAVKWKRKFSSPLYGAPVAVNDLVFSATADGLLYAFDGDTGEKAWKASLPAGFKAGLTVSGGTLLAPAGELLGKDQSPQLMAYRLPT